MRSSPFQAVRVVPWALAVSLVGLSAARVDAHPSLRNPLWVVAAADGVHVRVGATLREVQAAGSLAGGDVDGPGLARAIDDYPAYLLAHLRVAVGGVPLRGRMVHILRPRAAELANSPDHVHVRYDLDYTLPHGLAAGTLTLDQDVLREVHYAPGQPWDVTYAVRLEAGRSRPMRDGLLRVGHPLVFDVGDEGVATPAPGAPASGPLLGAYLAHGLDHIRTGLDHLLFVAALVLTAASLLDLLRVVGVFTLAHSLTLALAVAGLVRLPPAAVEPAIAASILFVAIQGVRRGARTRNRTRLLVAFGFGLVHGLGFAGGLLDAMRGLAGPPVAAAVVGFSAGVELGHLAVVVPLWAALALARRRLASASSLALPRYASAAVALGGAYFLCVAVSSNFTVSAQQRRVYLAPDNHTDFIWSATESEYAGSNGLFVKMLKYYLDQAAATAAKPPEVQSRFATDGSYWLWVYERTQSAAEFQRLIDRIKDGHISAPLSPLVLTYGGQPTEGILRGMYYPGRIERRYNLRFTLAQAMENQTLPFGLGSLWAGAGAQHVWHGVCDCDTQVTGLGNRGREIYRWVGADGTSVLTKWYSFSGNNASIGGYAEARNPDGAADYLLTDPGFQSRYPFPDVSGAFGQGWDDKETEDLTIRDTAEARNNADPTTKVVVSNEEDFFQDFEATYGSSPSLPSFSGSFGNEWDTNCVSLAEVSARVKRSVEALRPAEALATLVSLKTPTFMTSRTSARDLATMDMGLYFEHDFINGGPGATGPERIAWQRRLAGEIESYVNPLLSDATTALGGLIAKSGTSTRFYVFNPLGWARTDVADFRYSGPTPGRVVDLATGQDVPWQIVTVSGSTYLRLQAPNVPPVGYKVFEIRSDAGTAFSNPFTVDAATGLLDNGLYRLTVANRGAITSMQDETRGNREFVRTIGGQAVNDLGAGSGTLTVENQGLVSVTLRADVTTSSPVKHRTRITLFRDSDRVDIRNEVLENFGDTQYTWGYGFEITSPDIRHEEVGALLRAKLLAAGGSYSPANARYDWLTLNHFADVSGTGPFGVTLSNADAFFMKVGSSTATTLDTATPQISPLLGGLMDSSGITNQGGDSYFLQRFALRTHDAYDAPAAMRFALEHQNPFVAAAVTGGTAYPETTYSLLSVSDPNVLLWALKPAEDGIDQGIAARFWNLGAASSSFSVPVAPGLVSAQRTTHIETPLGPATVAGGALDGSAAGQQIVTYRLQPPGLGGTLQFGAAAYSVGEAAPRAIVTVKRAGATAGTASVDYEATNGTATAGADYGAASGTLTFGPGVTSRTFAVPIVDDTLVEGNETVLLRLANPGGGAELGAQATSVLTIVDDDHAGTLRFAVPAYTVGEAGPVATLTVTRTGGAASGVTVDYSTVDGTATAPADYQTTTGVLSFGAGATKASLTVPIVEDAQAEGDQTFRVVLSGPSTGAVLGAPSSAVVTITEDESTVQFPAPGLAVKESAGRAVVTVKRSGPTSVPATVDYQTSDGTAAAPGDYAATSGTLSFAPGITSRTFAVPIVKDAFVEGDETVLLKLLNPTGGPALGQQQTAVLTIQDDDVGGTLAFGAAVYHVKETAPSAVVTVRRTGGAAANVTVDYATADGTAHAGTNYDAATGTLTFGAGVATRTFAVPLHDDGVPTDDLTLGLSLANPQGGAGLGSPQQAVLSLDSAEPLVEFSAPAYSAGEAQGKAVVTVKRSGPATQQVTADYTTADGTATQPGDYTLSSGTLVFGPGVASRTFAVPIVHDAVVEGDETVLVRLTGAGGGAAVGEPSQAVLTIVSDSPKVQFGSAAYTVAESAPKATITVRRLPPTAAAVTVDYTTVDGSAHAGTDYTAASGTLTFAPGVVSRTFPVPITNDTVHEDGETVQLELSNPGQGAILGSPSTATLTIAGNDAAGALQFSAADFSVSESGGAAVVTVTRTGGVASDVTVAYATSDGTAVAGTDYEPTSGTLTFGAGETSRTFVVPALDDGLAGPNKTVVLTLSAPGGGGTLGARSTATLWIVDAH